jgi:hypothetical protein
MSKTTRRGLLAGAALGSVATLGARSEPSAARESAATQTSRLREYWIAAEPFRHCLVPTGRDAITGAVIDRSKATLTALRYRAYTRGWRKPPPGSRAGSKQRHARPRAARSGWRRHPRSLPQ